jgi:general secretion pathway protein D
MMQPLQRRCACLLGCLAILLAGRTLAQAPGPEIAVPKSQNLPAADAYVAGARALERNDLATAEAEFTRAAALDPGNHNYAVAVAVAREHRVTDLVHRAADAREHGRGVEADALLAEARTLDPQNSLVMQHMQADVNAPAPKLDVEASKVRGVRFTDAIALEPDKSVRSFHLRGDSQDAIRQVEQAYGIKVVFDSSVEHRQLRFDLDDVSYDRAIPLLFSMTHVFGVPVDNKTLLIARDSVENHQRLDRQVEETIYVPALTVEQMNDLRSILSNLFEVTKLAVEPNAGTIVLRATPDTVKAVNETLADLLDGGAEVIVDMKLYTVDKTHSRDIGFQPPQFGAYNVESAAQQLVTANQSLVNQAISQGLISPNESVVAEAIQLIASGLVTSSLLSNTVGIFGGSINPTTGAVSNAFTTTAITDSGALTFNLALNSSDARALDDVQVRVGDRQPAVFKTGTRYPITTSTYVTPSASSLSGLSVNGSSASNLLQQYLGSSSSVTIPQISYEDLGLTLSVTPTVQKAGTVSMKFDLKLEALAGTSLNNIPILNSRDLQSLVTVKDGETALVVSTLSKTESNAVTGLPGLAELPGYQVPTEQNGQQDSSELLLLITPHVVRHRAGSSVGPRIAVTLPAYERSE